jgi:predicted small secreted protein
MVKKIVVLSFVLIVIAAAVSGCYQTTQAPAQDGAGI